MCRLLTSSCAWCALRSWEPAARPSRGASVGPGRLVRIGATSRRRRRPALALGLLLIALAAGCADEPSRSRVLLVGLDGASPRIVREMFEAGELPHLAGLADRGLFVPLRSSIPLHSPRIWASIATGKTPEKHGIDAFVKRDEKGRNRLLLSSDRRTHALWNIVSDAGRRVAVINWWNTFPPEVIEGVMVSDHALPGEVERRRSAHEEHRRPGRSARVSPALGRASEGLPSRSRSRWTGPIPSRETTRCPDGAIQSASPRCFAAMRAPSTSHSLWKTRSIRIC